MQYPRPIQDLIDKLSQLPSVGPKTAERYVFYWLKKTNQDLSSLAENIKDLPKKITVCSRCRVYTEKNPCLICGDPKRNSKKLCLVENTQDLWAIENTKQYQGKYFVLGSLINAIENLGPDSLPIKKLSSLIKEEKPEELIIALNFTMEGETTSLYLEKIFRGIRISRLAKGLPSGSDLEYADQLTLANALKYRHRLK